MEKGYETSKDYVLGALGKYGILSKNNNNNNNNNKSSPNLSQHQDQSQQYQ